MGHGYLTVSVHTGDDALPVSGVYILIRDSKGTILFDAYTDESGNTEKFTLEAPPKSLTLDRDYHYPAYAKYDVDVQKAGFVNMHIHNVEIVDTITAILPVDLLPLATDAGVENPQGIAYVNSQSEAKINSQKAKINEVLVTGGGTDMDIFIPDVGLLVPTTTPQVGSNVQTFREVVIPEYITVHLGIPTNASARNVLVKFPDYIKNVVSSEIYPTWPESSLIANIHAITTFAINRVYTEWYRLRGFNFDITNSTAYDQYFVEGRNIFENISNLVDEYFNVFARRFGFRNPFFTQYCNGSTVTCAGLSQWGTVDLANRGYNPLRILRYYYPNDLELVESDNIAAISRTYPGYALRRGSSGDAVQVMQNYLNRIRANYPLIPPISNPNGVFGEETEAAVRAFQRIFNMTVDGIIGEASWNKISFIYVGVIRLAELESEGQRIGIGTTPPTSVLRLNSRGTDVLELQFILNFISPFYTSIPPVIQDNIFDASTQNAVVEFQKTFNLTQDGIVGPATWAKLYSVYHGVNDNVLVPPQIVPPAEIAPSYPGTSLRIGSSGPDVSLMQGYLNAIRTVYNSIPPIIVNGIFNGETRNAVIAFQQEFLLAVDGIIGPITWNKIIEQFLLVTGNASVSTDFPGYMLSIGSTGSSVRLIQGFLNQLSTVYPSIPTIDVDGIFGAQTRTAVVAFQRLFNLAQDGIVGPITWNAIVEQKNANFGV